MNNETWYNKRASTNRRGVKGFRYPLTESQKKVVERLKKAEANPPKIVHSFSQDLTMFFLGVLACFLLNFVGYVVITELFK